MLPNKIRKDKFEKQKLVFSTKNMDNVDDENLEKDFLEDIHNYPQYIDDNEHDNGEQVVCDKYYEYPGINQLSNHDLNIESIFSKTYEILLLNLTRVKTGSASLICFCSVMKELTEPTISFAISFMEPDSSNTITIAN